MVGKNKGGRSRREALQLVTGIGTATLAGTGVASANSTDGSRTNKKDNGELDQSGEDTNNDSLTISEDLIDKKLDENNSFTVEEGETIYKISRGDNKSQEGPITTTSNDVYRDFCITREIHKNIPVDICITLYECGADVEIDAGIATSGYELKCGETKCRTDEFDIGFGRIEWEICQETDGDIVISYEGSVWYGIGTEDVSGEIEVTR
ncbi:hypothetical protein HTG_13985 [Natrinema mahii]|nr:hypothetical protein HTG_13985 [Natrinema mahii]